MRLIDAEALKESIYGEKERIQYTQPFIQASLILLEKLIKNAPTIEAKPVVHAHWECDSSVDDFYCSNCNNKALRDYFENEVQSDYCPYCGAQMDEVVSDTNVGSKTDHIAEDGKKKEKEQ